MIGEGLKCNSTLTKLWLRGDEKEKIGRNNKEMKKRKREM